MARESLRKFSRSIGTLPACFAVHVREHGALLMMESIRVDSVVKQFGGTRALDGVSVEIAPGELFFLLGASGCGKTTLLRCIAGLEIPTSGSIHFGERDVTKLPPYKREAAMVFQIGRASCRERVLMPV